MRDWVNAQRPSDSGGSQRAELMSGPRPFAPGAIKMHRSRQHDISGDGWDLLCETLGELNQNAPIGWILDFSEGDDEPQSFDDVQIDLIVAKQLQQLIPGVIGIVDVHRQHSERP